MLEFVSKSSADRMVIGNMSIAGLQRAQLDKNYIVTMIFEQRDVVMYGNSGLKELVLHRDLLDHLDAIEIE